MHLGFSCRTALRKNVICCRWASKKALALLPMSIRGRIFCSLLYAFFTLFQLLARCC